MTGCFKGYQGRETLFQKTTNDSFFQLGVTRVDDPHWQQAHLQPDVLFDKRCHLSPITPPQNAPQLRCDETSSFDRCSSQATFSTSSRAVTVKRRLLWENFPPTIRRPHTMVEGQHTRSTQNTKHKHTQFYTDCVSWTGFQNLESRWNFSLSPCCWVFSWTSQLLFSSYYISCFMEATKFCFDPNNP